MDLIYTCEEIPTTITRSIFLAGPVPRETSVPSWKPEAIKILEDRGFDETVFVPEWKDFDTRQKATDPTREYITQCNWESDAMAVSDVILFWIPRNMKTMIGLTTNHEHGEWFMSGKTVLGFPRESENNDYLHVKSLQGVSGIPHDTLEETVDAALELIGDAAERSDGEKFIPSFIWRLGCFQRWYDGAIRESGDSVFDARLLYTNSARTGHVLLISTRMLNSKVVLTVKKEQFGSLGGWNIA